MTALGSIFSFVSSIEFGVDEFGYIDPPSFSVEVAEGDVFISILILVVDNAEGARTGSGLIVSHGFAGNEVVAVSAIFSGSNAHDVDGRVFGFSGGLLDFKGAVSESDKAAGKLAVDDEDDGGNTIAAADLDDEVGEDDDKALGTFTFIKSLYAFLTGSDTSIRRAFDFVVNLSC